MSYYLFGSPNLKWSEMGVLGRWESHIDLVFVVRWYEVCKYVRNSLSWSIIIIMACESKAAGWAMGEEMSHSRTSFTAVASFCLRVGLRDRRRFDDRCWRYIYLGMDFGSPSILFIQPNQAKACTLHPFCCTCASRRLSGHKCCMRLKSHTLKGKETYECISGPNERRRGEERLLRQK